MDIVDLRKRVRQILGTLAVAGILVVGASEATPPKILLQNNLNKIEKEFVRLDALQSQLKREKDRGNREELGEEILGLQAGISETIAEANENMNDFNKHNNLSSAGEQQRAKLNRQFYDFVKKFREEQQQTTNIILK